MDISKLNPEVYRKAANLILRRFEYCCCHALEATTKAGEDRLAYNEYLRLLFKPEDWTRLFWWDIGDLESRVFALLLCADILESERRVK
jgi:hypothetical protein